MWCFENAAIRIVMDWNPESKKATGSPSIEVDRYRKKRSYRHRSAELEGYSSSIERNGVI